MSCRETETKLEAFLNGELGGREAGAIRLHLASCRSCAARLSPQDLVEIAPLLDEKVLPSARLEERFHERLQAHRLGRAGKRRTAPSLRIFGTWPARFAAAGVLAAAICVIGVFLRFGGGGAYDSAPTDMEMTIGQNLPLLRDMAIIENLDMLEDFETIQSLPGSPVFQ